MLNIGRLFIILLFAQGVGAVTMTAAQTDAKKLLERISGTKVSFANPLVQQMADRISQNDYLGAAQIATTHPNFLNITVKLMALQMSTREETMRLKLNDFAASFIGVTRDETDARELLTGNFHYKADPTRIPAGITVRSNINDDIIKSNNHYNDLDVFGVNIGQVLARVAGQPMSPVANSTVILANPDPAGVLTSRSFLLAHTVAGTNRRPVEYTFREFMCIPIEMWADISTSDERIGRDIDRFPGGDNKKFLTNCKGCHTGMDGFRGAFANWDSSTDVVSNAILKNGGSFDANNVARKMNGNSTVFPDGYTVRNNSFINNAKGATNVALFGWRESQSGGNGLNQFGALIANSKRFSQCMVKRTYEAVCRKGIDIAGSATFINDMANRFEQNKYNLKRLFQDVSVSRECI